MHKRLLYICVTIIVLKWNLSFTTAQDGDVPRATSYVVYISQLVRFSRACNDVNDFNDRNLCITEKRLKQGYRYHKLTKIFCKFYRRYPDLIHKYSCSLKSLLKQENVALHKSADQISTWTDFTGPWIAQNAVDGNKSCDTGDGRHYSATDASYNPWWKVDLGRLYNISTIVVYGQKDHREQLEGFLVYLTSEYPVPDNLSSSYLVYNSSTYESIGIFNITTSTVARYCLIRRQRAFAVIVLCEVEIFGTEIDLIQRIKRNVITTMSSTLYFSPTTTSWYSENAIDGRYSGDPNTCFCCSGTSGWEEPWWQIDLGDRYIIERVKIYGRTDGNSEQYSNLWIFVGDSSLVMTNASLVYHGNSTEGAYIYDLSLNPARLFRFLIVRKFQRGFITICEVQLYESKCASNTFGNNCSQSCHCAQNESCYHADGTITCDSCAPGWMGNTCSTPCVIGTYGDNCANICSDHCLNGKSQCNNVTGHCEQGCSDGYTGPKCDHACPSGRYGRNCTELCEHCHSVDQCNPVNGTCSNGCKSGYDGDTCKSECEDGKFGNSCSNFCHCRNDIACDKKTGRCSNGCDIMWSGDTCSEYDGFDLSHLKNATTQIGTFYFYGADRAVDRVNNYSVGTCMCCSVAQNKENVPKAWWQIDLGQKYLIDAVGLFGRSDNSEQLQIERAAVYASNQSLSGNFSSGTLVYTVPSSIEDKYHFVHQLDSSIIARFFIIRINQTILTLCEFQLRKKVCIVGSFGENCSQQCHCKDDLQCNPVTGYCPNKECEPGWKGDACNAKCKNQTFGYGCNNTCHCSSCEPADGTCHTQCYPGWKGSSCSQDSNLISLIKRNASTSMSSIYNDTWESYLAIDGNIGPDPAQCKCCARTNNAAMSWWSIDLGLKYPISSITIFGRNEVPDIGQQLEGFQILLSNTSLFDQTIVFMDNSSHVSSAYSVEVNNLLARFIKVQRPGVLTLCEVLVQEGECSPGYFGTECSRTCKCLDNKPCSRSSGVCSTPFCQLGYRGIACDSECLHGTFGENCKERCFCAKGDICSSDHGLCPGRCDLGYYGPQCNKEIAFDHNTQKQNSSAAASQGIQISLVIGVSVGSFILVTSVTCLIIFKLYRRHTQKRDKENNTYMQSNFNAATNDADYDTLEVPQSEYINNRYVNDQASAL